MSFLIILIKWNTKFTLISTFNKYLLIISICLLYSITYTKSKCIFISTYQWYHLRYEKLAFQRFAVFENVFEYILSNTNTPSIKYNHKYKYAFLNSIKYKYAVSDSIKYKYKYTRICICICICKYKYVFDPRSDKDTLKYDLSH